jgi:hypothetical protein
MLLKATTAPPSATAAASPVVAAAATRRSRHHKLDLRCSSAAVAAEAPPADPRQLQSRRSANYQPSSWDYDALLSLNGGGSRDHLVSRSSVFAFKKNFKKNLEISSYWDLSSYCLLKLRLNVT